MYPIMRHELMQARVADLHRQAQRDAQARATRQARRAQAHQHRQPGQALPALMARRLRTALGSGTQ
jgi:hypothetical protein